MSEQNGAARQIRRRVISEEIHEGPVRAHAYVCEAASCMSAQAHEITLRLGEAAAEAGMDDVVIKRVGLHPSPSAPPSPRRSVISCACADMQLAASHTYAWARAWISSLMTRGAGSGAPRRSARLHIASQPGDQRARRPWTSPSIAAGARCTRRGHRAEACRGVVCLGRTPRFRTRGGRISLAPLM